MQKILHRDSAPLIDCLIGVDSRNLINKTFIGGRVSRYIPTASVTNHMVETKLRWGQCLVHTHCPSHKPYCRAQTQTGAVPGTYSRPQLQSVLPRSRLYLDNQLSHTAGIDQLWSWRCKRPDLECVDQTPLTFNNHPASIYWLDR